MFKIKIKSGTIQCETAEDVFKIIKEFSDSETFWDDAINDEVGEDFYAFGKYYKPATVLKAVDREKFDDVCKQFWNECKQDFIDEINDIGQNEIITMYGFEVQKCRT